MTNAEILFERRGKAGLVILNRPAQLNALSHAMVHALSQRLAAWETDPAVCHVVVMGAGEKAFCAGGDVRKIAELGMAGRRAEAIAFWRDEYRLNAQIKRYPKPYVALIDGIVMGGGAGISVHGSHRVAGDRLLFAMPEVGIGFCPDVGGSFFLSRLPDALGIYLALTGARLHADDATKAGLATHRVPSARFGALLEGLTQTDAVDPVLAALSQPLSEGPVWRRREAIARLFAGATVEDILAALDAEASSNGADADFARDTAATIRTKSPTSLKLALAEMQAGKTLDLISCLNLEFRMATRVMQGHDFYEGIRALLIDKDNKPRWKPASLADIGKADIAAHFAPLLEDAIPQ
ncbi:MAG: enoyl-CoA hydratase/isomerase family protein [Pseudorhodoplanes sp.]